MTYDAKNKIITQDAYDLGRMRMTDILRGCRAVFIQERMPNVFSSVPYSFEIPTNHKLLMGVGTTGLIFKLPDVFKTWDVKKSKARDYVNFIGKCSFYANMVEGFYDACLKPAGLQNGSLEKTISSLEDMGLPVLKMKEYCENIEEKYSYFTIMPDLRDGEKYEVASADEFDFDLVQNGVVLKNNFEVACRYIQKQCKNEYNIEVEGHQSDEGPVEAIKHIFLVQYIPKEEGKLFIADLDHLRISKK